MWPFKSCSFGKMTPRLQNTIKVIYGFNFTSENINETDRVFEMLTYQLAPQPLPIWGQQHHTGSQQRSNLDHDDGSCFMQVETASSVLRLNIMSPFFRGQDLAIFCGREEPWEVHLTWWWNNWLLYTWVVYIWVFPKIGVGPPNHPLKDRVFHYQPSISGYLYFWKHPYIHNHT